MKCVKRLWKIIRGKKFVFDLHVSSEQITREDLSSGKFIVFEGIPMKYFKFFKIFLQRHNSKGWNNNIHYSIFFREVE